MGIVIGNHLRAEPVNSNKKQFRLRKRETATNGKAPKTARTRTKGQGHRHKEIKRSDLAPVSIYQRRRNTADSNPPGKRRVSTTNKNKGLKARGGEKKNEARYADENTKIKADIGRETRWREKWKILTFPPYR